MAHYDFYFQLGQTLDLGIPKQRFENNKQAIQLAKELASSGREVEPEELAILSKYIGWGDSRLASRVHELTELLTDDELRSARGSSLNAHCTALVLATWSCARNFPGFWGKTVGRYLDIVPLFITESGSSLIGKFLLWLQNRIKHWTKPAPPARISGLLSDLIHSRTDLVVENALLRQQLIVLKRQVKRPRLTVFVSFSFPTSPDSGNNRCISHSRKHSCAGIGSCFATTGGGSRKANRRFPPRQLR